MNEALEGKQLVAKGRVLKGWIQYLVVVSVLAVFFALGWRVSGDAGIGWDEMNNRLYGQIMAQQYTGGPGYLEILKRNPDVRNNKETQAFWHPTRGQFAMTHGPVYEVFLHALERFFGLKDLRQIYHFRHRANFTMFFLGVCFMFLLGTWLFGHSGYGLLGSTFLFLSPRLFGHAFHNSIDIPFLTLFLLSFVTMVGFLKSKTKVWAVAHGVTIALLISVRIVGGLSVLLLFVFVVLEWRWGQSKTTGRQYLTSMLLFVCVSGVLFVLFWPLLWSAPASQFLKALTTSSKDPWGFWELYAGEPVVGQLIPWHFSVVWFGITTPLLYQVFFVAGVVRIVKDFRFKSSVYVRDRFLWLGLFAFVLPLVVVAVMHATLFNAWRHLYFIYAGFLVVALAGVQQGVRWVGQIQPYSRRRVVSAVCVVLVFLSLSGTARDMIHYHPYQHVFFNSIVGGVKGAKGKYEIGYWAVEYRAALEYILKHDKRPQITVRIIDEGTSFNRFLLSPSDRKRLVFRLGHNKPADYYISNYYHCGSAGKVFAPDLHQPSREVWSLSRGGAKLVTVYYLGQSSDNR